MLNRRQILKYIGALYVFPFNLFQITQNKTILSKKELYLCDLIAKVITGALVYKIIDDDLHLRPNEKFEGCCLDTSLLKCHKIGWYTYIHCVEKSIATSICVKLDFLPSTNGSVKGTIANLEEIHKVVNNLILHYWNDLYNLNNFNLEQHNINVERLINIIC